MMASGARPLESAQVRQTPDADAFATYGDHEAAVLVWNYHDVEGAAASHNDSKR